MQDRSDNFPRAQNLSTFGVYGDPERWGDSTDVVVVANADDKFTKQLLRVQCANLFATSWDLLLTWAQIDGDALNTATDKLSIGAQLSVGVGQATTDIAWVPMSQNVRLGEAAFLGLSRQTGNLSRPWSGAALITLPANAINGLIRVQLTSDDPPKQARFNVSLQAAPRVGVSR